MTDNDRILSFEGLRGLLALWVVGFHLLNLAGIPAAALGPLDFLAEGGHPVDVFIIMSGFFIFFLLNAKQETYRPFIARRCLRIFPAYLIALFLAIPMIDVSMSALQSLPWRTPHIVAVMHIFESCKEHFWLHLPIHLTLLQGVVPDSVLAYSAYTFLGVAWSVSLEWQFYLIAPALMAGFKAKNRLIPLLMSLALFGLYWAFQSKAYMGFLPQKLPFFLLGIVSFFAWKEKSTSWMITLAVTSLAFFLLVSKISIVIWMVVFFATYFGRVSFLSLPPLRYLGKISYSVYIIHMLPVYLVVTLLNSLKIQSHPLFFALSALLAIPLTLGAAHWLYHLIEAPCIQWGKKLSFSKAPEPQAAIPESA